MSREKGVRAEEAATQFLKGLGFVVLARNFWVQGAEVDIIAREGDVIAFIEVKYRGSTRYAAPREAVTPAKQRRIRMAAMCWLQENSLQDADVRFDILEIMPGGMALLRGAFA